MGNNAYRRPAKTLLTPGGTRFVPQPESEPDMGATVSAAISGLEVVDGENLVPLEYNVLLKIAGKERVTRGGIILSPAEVDKQLFSSCKAEIVSFGEECFRNGDGSGLANRPQVGDHVLISKYPGIPFRDSEYNLYRFAHDKDVVAIIKRKGAK